MSDADEEYSCDEPPPRRHRRYKPEGAIELLWWNWERWGDRPADLSLSDPENARLALDMGFDRWLWYWGFQRCGCAGNPYWVTFMRTRRAGMDLDH